ncbi:tRNA (adenosine(37)-N6)-threonylcarbamoyltransferase complex dimerization subunit type 1 TsaB [Mediterraneibacter massiliensis]|uniref:tRNA (adenosine(37)-N6)-threonylcarbamoyltransferase complex dimerization subunit type 1 TsaB n=1 Tax=Mediterraneibacter massiliensis TaxID=1720300 RepID=UPI0024ACC7B2|nr:tRNA (adenosine(37)-N6)-threonylcarbamoyltransferase complex dimerization subunit type 1 TsaB [Mediterraneibacter massiliensis]
MKVLAIDSSGLTAAVAVVDEEQTIAEYTVNYKKTHSQTLLPMIHEIVKMVELNLREVDAIAVAGGPGSFTGLRIGSATAKGLGLALDKPLISVPTVDALAYNVYGCTDIICPIMDARRKQVYTGMYTFSRKAGEIEGENLVSPVFQVMKMQMAISVEELIGRLNRYGRPVVFLGDGVPVYAALLKEGLKVPYSFAPSYMNRQRAAALGALGILYYKAGKYESAREHSPDYLRVSQAERERALREKQEKLILRELKEEDAAAVSEMEHQLFSDGWSEKGILETVKNPNTICLAAVKAEKLIGYVFVYFAAGEGEIAKIAVTKERQRQGVAHQMMKELERICKSRKIGKLMLDVRQSNETAQAFYKAQGFVRDGERKAFYEKPSEDAVLMSREIAYW